LPTRRAWTFKACAPSTAAEHIRKAEAALVESAFALE